MTFTIEQADYNNALIASKESYYQHEVNEIIEGGLNYIGGLDADNHKIDVYENTATGKYIIAFRGTEVKEFVKDMQTNVQIANDQVPGEFDQAKAYVESVVLQYGLDNIEMITGHSQGGALAQMIGSLQEYSSIKTVTINGVGTEHLQDNLVAQGNTLGDYSNIYNFGDGEDVVFRLFDQVGNTLTVNSNASTYNSFTANRTPLSTQLLLSYLGVDSSLYQFITPETLSLVSDHIFGELGSKDQYGNFIDISNFKVGDLASFKLNEWVQSQKDKLGVLALKIYGSLHNSPYTSPFSFILTSFNSAEAAAQTVRIDPLILDLDADGMETTTVNNGVYFDHGVDGFSETSAWVGADDGFLKQVA